MNARHRALSACVLLLCAALALPAAGQPACRSPAPSAAGLACGPQTTDTLASSPVAADTIEGRYAQTDGPSPDPVIFVNTTDIEYGEVSVGTTATAAVTVRNDGEGTLRIKDLSVVGDSDAVSLLTNGTESTDGGGGLATPPNFTLDPGESEQVGVAFEPSAPEEYGATLSIDSDDPDSPTTNVSLSGRGVQAADPDLSVTRSVTFDDATVGQQSVRNLTLSNTGDGDLVLSDATIQPADGDFELVAAPDDTVPPGGSTTVTVGFEPSTPDATSGTLSLSTNDPDDRTVYVALSSSRAAVNVSVDRTGNATDLTATVTNATAGESVSVPVPADPDDPDPTDVDSISVTPTRNGSFDLGVTSTDDPPASATPFAVGDPTEPSELGYLNVTHSIPNENISQATIRYRVNRTRMAQLESEPDDFALYRLTDGTWERVNTTLVRETDTSYVFRSTAAGLSEWTAATEVPRISVSDATANVTAITTEEAVEIRVLLNNTGGSDGRFEVELLLNGSVVERRDVAVSPETTSLVTFQRSFEQTGTYGVEVNDFFVAAVEVSEGEAEVIEGGQVGTTSGGTDSSGGSGLLLPGFAAVVVALAALGGVVAYRSSLVGGDTATDAAPDIGDGTDDAASDDDDTGPPDDAASDDADASATAPAPGGADGTDSAADTGVPPADDEGPPDEPADDDAPADASADEAPADQPDGESTDTPDDASTATSDADLIDDTVPDRTDPFDAELIDDPESPPDDNLIDEAEPDGSSDDDLTDEGGPDPSSDDAEESAADDSAVDDEDDGGR